jgi:thioredoxin 1
MAPILDELAIEFDGKIKIAKLDVEDQKHAEIAAKFNIQSIPNMKLFKNGTVANEYVGYRDKERFTTELTQAL